MYAMFCEKIKKRDPCWEEENSSSFQLLSWLEPPDPVRKKRGLLDNTPWK
jgi:hypothetical protein